MVQHQVVAVRVLEERHVADARVEDLAVELDALRLELGPRLGDVRDAQRDVRVRCGANVAADPLGLPDAEADVAGPELGPGVLVERRRPSVST